MKLSRFIAIVFVVSYALLLPAGCQQQAKVAEEPVLDAAPVAAETPAEAPAEATEPDKPAPKIEFENMVYDFGKVGPGQKLLGEFKFTNTGDAPLKITKVEKCCGAVTRLDKTDYPPGESGVLKVRYTASRLPSKTNKRLYVNSDDPVNPRVMLTIQAQTVLKVTYEPKSMRLLLKDENAGCPPITIKSIDNKPFSITQFQATNDALTAEIDSSVEATEFVLRPKADLDKLRRSRTGRINIGLAYSEPNVPSEKITIIFQSMSRFSFKPSNLVFLYSEPQEPIKKSLWLLNNYDEDFEVESTSSKEGHIKLLGQRKVGKRYLFELEITPPGHDARRFDDTFTVNLRGGEKMDIPCRGIYRTPTTKKAGQ